MIENFIEYMWYLLTTPYKRVEKSLNKWYILCRVFGRRFDEAKEDILRARDEGMVATCCHELLPVHGADRRLSRYEGEHPENFRSRVAMYEELCKLGGTNEGILLALRTLGYSSPELIRANDLRGFRHFTLDGSWCLDGSWQLESDNIENRWAEFYVIVTLPVAEEHPISFKILQKTVRKWKEVGAKDNYAFRYTLDIQEINNVRFLSVYYKKRLCHFDCKKLDGMWGLDGSYMLNAEQARYPARQIYHFCVQEKSGNNYTVMWHEQHNLNFLNGAWDLDGSKKIDAWQKTEVL